MIVKMKRITVLSLQSHSSEVIRQLRDTGIVHITPVQSPDNPKVEHIADAIYLSEKALMHLSASSSKQLEPDNVMSTVNHIVDLTEYFDTCEDELAILEQEMQRASFFGDFNPEDIAFLEKHGIFITLYEISPKEKKNLIPNDNCTFFLGESQTRKQIIALVSYREKKMFAANQISLPRLSSSQLSKEIAIKKKEYDNIKSEIIKHSMYSDAINKNLLKLKSTLEFEMVRSGIGRSEEVIYLQGYCPQNLVPVLEKNARHYGWGLLIDNPAHDEVPPTQIKNPQWVHLISPVFKILNTLPGYRELDISAIFLIFFSIFFGMIIGDAGYGTLFLLITAATQRATRNKIKNKTPFYLMYVLCSITIIWGALTGNWFGVQHLTQVEPFRWFIIPSLNAYTDKAQEIVINICFYLAAIHLSLAHLLVITKNVHFFNLLVNVGWILMVWVMFCVARNQVMGIALPTFFPQLLISASALVFIFTFFNKAPGQGIAEILIANIILATINTFADTISYIRLFAVGLATLAVAQSFNDIALQVGFGSVFTALGASLILFVGHALNIALAAMAVIVHGVRLNMLEFSSHVGNTWSGYPYDPFRKKSEQV